MNFLLIGGAGYIGSNVAYLLAKSKNNKIIIYDNLSTSTNKITIFKNASFVLGSQLDYIKLDEIMKKYQPDVVMHFAAKIIVSESVAQPLDYFENNVVGMINILKAMQVNNVKRLVFSSTAATYGNPKSIPILESDPTSPINPYGASKLSCEYLIKASHEAYGINSIIFRYFNVAGTSDDYNFGIYNKNSTLLIPRIVRSILQEKSLSIFGNDYNTKDGTCIRDYVHVIDLANAHLKGSDYLQTQKGTFTFNIGSNRGYSVLECLQIAKKTLKKEIKYQFEKRRLGDPDVLITSNQKIKELLQWEPEKSLADMIKSEYQFQKKHQLF